MLCIVCLLEHIAPCLQLPGQMIGIRYCAEGKEEPTQTAKRLFAIASSPYDSRRDSSMLDASMIEVSLTSVLHICILPTHCEEDSSNDPGAVM